MAVGTSFLGQYSVFCVFGLVGGCVVVPLITQSFETMFFSALVVGLATVSKLQLSNKAQGVEAVNRQKEKDARKLKHVGADAMSARSRKKKPQDAEIARRKREEDSRKAEDEELKELERLERREEEKREKKLRKKQERLKRKEQEKMEREKEQQHRTFRPRVGSASSAQAFSKVAPTKSQQSSPLGHTFSHSSSTPDLFSTSTSQSSAGSSPASDISDTRWQPVASVGTKPPSPQSSQRKPVSELRPSRTSPADWNAKFHELTRPNTYVKPPRLLRAAASAPRTVASPLVPSSSSQLEVVDRALQQVISSGVSHQPENSSVQTTTTPTSSSSGSSRVTNTSVVAPLGHSATPTAWQGTASWEQHPDPLPMPRRDIFENSRVNKQPVATVNPTVRSMPAPSVYTGKAHLSPVLQKPSVPAVPESEASSQRYYSLWNSGPSFSSNAFGHIVPPHWQSNAIPQSTNSQHPW